MDYNNTHIFEKTYKQFISGILYFIISSYIIGVFVCYPLLFPFNYIYLIGCIFNVGAVIVVHIIPMIYIRKFTIFYFAHILFSLFPLTIWCLLSGIAGPLFWYINVPVCVYTIFTNKRAIQISIFCLFLMLSAFALVFLIIPDDFAAVNSLPFINLLHIYLIDSIYAFLLACYSLYFIRRFHQIQIGQQCNATKLDKRKIENILLNSEKYNEVKFVKIYEQIVAYFETKQPYLNINFKIGKMAHDLNINTVYLAKAIRLKQNMNFNNFVNFYRIEKAKELIRNTASKYTLEYIYLSSGFKSQSSFNAAFKFKEGITPSVYVQRVKNTD